jgi:hypothetical protein
MQRIDLDSTALEAATYQEQLALLELEFRSGAIYQYGGVPAQTYQELLLAESKGGYFHSHTRDHFPYAKIHPAEPKPRSRIQHQPTAQRARR